MIYKDYSSIQSRIDRIYNEVWFQPNASYPTNFGYFIQTEKKTDYQNLLNSCINVKALEDAKKGTLYYPETILKNFDEFLTLENEALKEAVTSTACLDYFCTIKGLKTPSLSFIKSRGSLSTKNATEENSQITLEFLTDRDFKVLSFLQAWQSMWFSHDKTKRSLASKYWSTKVAEGQKKKGGEGYLGISNLLIQTDGNVETKSHLSVFGLVPLQINPPTTDLGPQLSPSNLPKITVNCIYSVAILSYFVVTEIAPDGTKLGHLQYFYFS